MTEELADSRQQTAGEGEAPRESPGSKPHRRKARWRLVILLAVVACVWFWHASILRGLAGFLIVGQPQAGWDYLWIRGDVYGCDGDRGYDKAAGLYHEDSSRRIILVGRHLERLVQVGALPSFEALSRRELQKRRVPPGAITVIAGEARDEWEEARLLGAWLKDRPGVGVLLVCDRFGSRRLRCILDSVLGGLDAARVQILALPDRRYDETNWWKSRRGVKEFMRACLTVVYAWCQGEDRVVPELWDPDDYEKRLRQAAREG